MLGSILGGLVIFTILKAFTEPPPDYDEDPHGWLSEQMLDDMMYDYQDDDYDDDY